MTAAALLSERRSGSDAEERIRLKAEAALRAAWPSARIIHELVLEQGGCRIDLAGVTADRIIAVEIKSERDVLTRLKAQVDAARKVADSISVIVASKYLDNAREIAGWLNVCAEDDALTHLLRQQRGAYESCCNAPARLQMLWASELRAVAASGNKATRLFSIRKASDELTGAEVRRRVCAALRARYFPRADAPITSELFPAIGIFAGTA